MKILMICASIVRAELGRAVFNSSIFGKAIRDFVFRTQIQNIGLFFLGE